MSPVFAHGQLRLYLLVVLADGPRHGYEIIRDLERRFDGLYSPSAGTIYPRLSRLEGEGLVARAEDGRKVVYRITDAGRAEIDQRRSEVQNLQVDLDRTVHRLAAQVRAQVRGGSSHLRAELVAAARTARKHALDEPPRPTFSGAGPGRTAPVDLALDELCRSLRATATKQWIDSDSMAEVVSIVERARDDVFGVVQRAVRARRHRL